MPTLEHQMKSLCKGKVARVTVSTAGAGFYAHAYQDVSWEEIAKSQTDPISLQALSEKAARAAATPIAHGSGKTIDGALAAFREVLAIKE